MSLRDFFIDKQIVSVVGAQTIKNKQEDDHEKNHYPMPCRVYSRGNRLPEERRGE
jgi:hypothetical protein